MVAHAAGFVRVAGNRRPADAALPEIEGIVVTASVGVAATVPGLEQHPDAPIARGPRALRGQGRPEWLTLRR